ncbi:MAG: hypothetical protein C7B45_06465 [Sulfobacillus acidophilus]|uniref:Exo-alpha-sialidase n=1 Tax=Sulfobacillus acidophilus TaxID=53633 RepID=A0A2T2WK02_9FIRM|nr:MAG: hypothetical protein C7B45_06465 [Sulfobacillus acidophilus]
MQLTQSANGAIKGSFQVPAGVESGEILKTGKNFLALSYQFLRNGQSITFATTPFTILAPKTWHSLGRFQPLSVTSNQSSNTFNEPTPVSVGHGIIAVETTPGTLWLRVDKKWKAVHTQPLAALAQSSGYPVLVGGNEEPALTSVTMVEGYPQSLFVAVQAASQKYGGSIPPIYNTPYYSMNLGASWNSVPIPDGYTAGDFGGYITQGHTVIAYFSAGTHWTAESSRNGGKSWVDASALPKPQDGLALQLGPMQNGNFGQMGAGEYQTVLRLNHHGKWVTAATFSNMVGTTTLAILSSSKALLLEPDGAYPLQYTSNAGKTWTYVALPQIPQAQAGSQTTRMLGNGDILEQATVNHQTQPQWFVLKPGSKTWTKVPTSVIPANVFTISVNGTSVWWIQDDGSSTAAPTVLSVNENRLP